MIISVALGSKLYLKELVLAQLQSPSHKSFHTNYTHWVCTHMETLVVLCWLHVNCHNCYCLIYLSDYYISIVIAGIHRARWKCPSYLVPDSAALVTHGSPEFSDSKELGEIVPPRQNNSRCVVLWVYFVPAKIFYLLAVMVFCQWSQHTCSGCSSRSGEQSSD